MEDVKIKPTESQTIRKSKVAPKTKSRRARTGIRIIEVEGIGPTYAEKLNSVNILQRLIYWNPVRRLVEEKS